MLCYPMTPSHPEAKAGYLPICRWRVLELSPTECCFRFTILHIGAKKPHNASGSKKIPLAGTNIPKQKSNSDIFDWWILNLCLVNFCRPRRCRESARPVLDFCESTGEVPEQIFSAEKDFCANAGIFAQQKFLCKCQCLSVCLSAVFLSVYCLSTVCLSTVCLLSVSLLSVYCLSVYCLSTVCLLSVRLLSVCLLSVYCLSTVCLSTVCLLWVYCLSVHFLSTVSVLSVYRLSVYCLSIVCLSTVCLSTVGLLSTRISIKDQRRPKSVRGKKVLALKLQGRMQKTSKTTMGTRKI